MQQWASGRWRTILTPGGIPVDDRRGASWPDDQTGEQMNDFFGELMTRYARGWSG